MMTKRSSTSVISIVALYHRHRNPMSSNHRTLQSQKPWRSLFNMFLKLSWYSNKLTKKEFQVSRSCSLKRLHLGKRKIFFQAKVWDLISLKFQQQCARKMRPSARLHTRWDSSQEAKAFSESSKWAPRRRRRIRLSRWLTFSLRAMGQNEY